MDILIWMICPQMAVCQVHSPGLSSLWGPQLQVRSIATFTLKLVMTVPGIDTEMWKNISNILQLCMNAGNTKGFGCPELQMCFQTLHSFLQTSLTKCWNVWVVAVHACLCSFLNTTQMFYNRCSHIVWHLSLSFIISSSFFSGKRKTKRNKKNSNSESEEWYTGRFCFNAEFIIDSKWDKKNWLLTGERSLLRGPRPTAAQNLLAHCRLFFMFRTNLGGKITQPSIR